MDERNAPEREQRDDGACKKGQTSTLSVTASVMPTTLVKAGVGGGLVAGFIFLALQVVTSSAGDIVAPFRLLASLSLAEAAMSPSAPVLTVVLVGILDNTLVSVFWGLVFGLALSCSNRGWSGGATVTLGVLLGAIAWVVDFYVFAPLFWPWIQGASSVFQFVGHVFFFGLPFGVWVSWHTSERAET